MSIDEVKKKAVDGLRSKVSNVVVSYNDVKDENYKRYKFGEITLIDFVSGISDTSPYQIVETTDNTFLIIDKKIVLPPQSFLDPNTTKTIFTSENKGAIIGLFPELKDIIVKIYDEIEVAGCTGCTKNSKLHLFIQEILYLDNKNRDLEKLSSLFGERFASKLISFPKQNKPTIKNNQIPKQPVQKVSAEEIPRPDVKMENGPRPSCLECCMKHLGTAIVLLEEAGNGYPAHRWLAAGELNEAANEVMRDFPDVAQEIREYRHLVTKDPKKTPDLMEFLNKMDKRFFPS